MLPTRALRQITEITSLVSVSQLRNVEGWPGRLWGVWPLSLARFPTGAQSRLCECEFQAQREDRGEINAVQKGCSPASVSCHWGI